MQFSVLHNTETKEHQAILQLSEIQQVYNFLWIACTRSKYGDFEGDKAQG